MSLSETEFSVSDHRGFLFQRAVLVLLNLFPIENLHFSNVTEQV